MLGQSFGQVRLQCYMFASLTVVPSLTDYTFGLQELIYTSSDNYGSQIDYYSLAGHLISWSNGTTTT